MKFSEYLKENQKEFVIWGIPQGKKEEVVLYTKAKSQSEAEKVIEILKKKYNARNLRIQLLDLSKLPDFKSTINL